MRRTLSILLATIPLASGASIYLGCSNDMADCILTKVPCTPSGQSGSGAGNPGSSSGSGGATPVCGDGVINGTEQCDGADLAGNMDCTNLGYVSPGMLACDNNCMFTGCMAECANGSQEPGEDCEPPSTDSDGNKCGADCTFLAIINEVLYDTVMGGGNDMGCYIELKGPRGMSLDGYALHFINGVDGQPYNNSPLTLTSESIGANGYFLIGQDAMVTPDAGSCSFLADDRANMQNSFGNLLLYKGNSVVDALGYDFDMPGTFQGEGMPAVDANQTSSSSDSLSRSPDGTDTDDNSADFKSTSQTPCGPNP